MIIRLSWSEMVAEEEKDDDNIYDFNEKNIGIITIYNLIYICLKIYFL